MRIQYFYKKEIFIIIKRLKYIYHHLKPTAIDHRLPSAVLQHRLLSTIRYLPTTRHRRSGSMPPSLSRIFLKNLSNIFINLIYTLNIPKILYLKILFLKIIFLKYYIQEWKFIPSNKYTRNRDYKPAMTTVMKSQWCYRTCHNKQTDLTKTLYVKELIFVLIVEHIASKNE